MSLLKMLNFRSTLSRQSLSASLVTEGWGFSRTSRTTSPSQLMNLTAGLLPEQLKNAERTILCQKKKKGNSRLLRRTNDAWLRYSVLSQLPEVTVCLEGMQPNLLRATKGHSPRDWRKKQQNQCNLLPCWKIWQRFVHSMASTTFVLAVRAQHLVPYIGVAAG